MAWPGLLEIPASNAPQFLNKDRNKHHWGDFETIKPICLDLSFCNVIGADIVETIIDKLIETNTELFEGLLSDKDRNDLAKLLGRLSEGLLQKRSLGR
ncbi:MAG: hypothetical protein ACSHXD_16010 [Marinosulfonomonas sp.]|jgi:hypothetical protein